jgi:hypothetical protein
VPLFRVLNRKIRAEWEGRAAALIAFAKIGKQSKRIAEPGDLRSLNPEATALSRFSTGAPPDNLQLPRERERRKK